MSFFNDKKILTVVRTERIGVNDLLDLVYPVGSIYMSVNNVSPQTFLGGTWTQIQETFLLAAGSNHAAGTTGGSATHTPSGSVTVNNHTLTVDEMPSHNHDEIGWNTYENRGYQIGYGSSGSEWGLSGDTLLGGTASGNKTGLMRTGARGGGQGHNHTASFSGTSADTMPPYLAVYMWKRTA